MIALRVAQAALLVAAVVSGLAWMDTGERVVPLGSDALALDVAAPVAEERGPWLVGDVLTEADAGVDVDVAPQWTVTATRTASGVDVEEGAWSAALTIEKVGGDGRTWWSVVEEVEPEVEGDAASFPLDAAALVARAQALDNATRTPGRLDLTLAVVHAGDVVVGTDRHAVVRTSLLQIAPSGSLVSLGVVEDSGDWSTVEPAPTPWTTMLLGAGAAAAEIPARLAARRVPAWRRARGVDVVEAAGVTIPDVPRTDLATALGVAKRTGGVVLVDRARGLAVVQGAVALVAPLDGSTPVPPAPQGPFRPLVPLDDVFRAPPEGELEVVGAVPPPVLPFPGLADEERRRGRAR